jgi:hypothetical protein
VRVKRPQAVLPAGFHRGGARFATLTEVVSPAVSTRQGEELTEDEKIRLTLKRVAAQDRIALASLGVGAIGKGRALAEIRAQTRLGRALVDIEVKTVDVLRQELEKRARRRKKARR